MESLFFFSFVYIMELIFSTRWYPAYFKIGIPIYSKAYTFHRTTPKPIGEATLNEAFKQKLTPSLLFKEIEPNTFAFREPFFQFKLLSYAPLMHGRLDINPNSRHIKVIGLVNWSFLAFIMILFFVISNHRDFVPIMIFFLSSFGVIYIFQRVKYEKVGKFAFEWNSRDWSNKN